MNNYILLAVFLLLLSSCDNSKELSLNPLKPNIEATANDIKNWGFEAVSFDHGICVSSKELNNSEMFFYMDGADCENVKGQSILYYLDTLNYIVNPEDFTDRNYEKWFRMNRFEFQEDSLKIIEMIKGFGGEKVSNTERAGHSEFLKFLVRKKGSQENFEVVYSAFPYRQKSFSFEKHWD